MSRKRISVDAAIAAATPVIQFRGVDYPLRDLTVRERIERTLEVKAEQEAIETRAEEEDWSEAEFGEYLQKTMAKSMQAALEGVPDEVAESITEREFEALLVAVGEARNLTFTMAVEDVGEEDLKMAGTGGTD